MARGKKAKPRLSLCMIVRDEEAYLEDCLKSVAGVVDEVIIVDTGSTDGTVALAHKHGAAVVAFAWADDFAAARNESLAHATGDWILYLDADERLDEKSLPELRNILNMTGPLFVNVWVDNVQRDGKSVQITRGHRLFRNVPGVRFSGRVHEQVSPFFETIQGREHFSSIRITHLGYAKNRDEMKRKEARNYALLCRQIEDEPDNPYWHFTLAQNLMLSGRHDEARGALNRALAVGTLPDDIRCTIFNNLAEIHIHLGQLDEAVAFANRAIELTPQQSLAYLLLYKAYKGLQNTARQIDCLQQVLSLAEAQATSCPDVSADVAVPRAVLYFNLGRLYLHESQFSRGSACFERALALQPDHTEAALGLCECMIASGELQRAREVLAPLRERQPKNATVLERLVWLSIKQQDFQGAIAYCLELLQSNPADDKLRKRLAALYHKVGDSEKALQYLNDACTSC